MPNAQRETLPLNAIDSRARFVIYSRVTGIISEHEKVSEAAVAFYTFAAREGLSQALPIIYKRQSEGWVPV